MPIQVNIPLVGEQFGPGSQISVQTNYQPVEPGTIEWWFAIRRSADEKIGIMVQILQHVGGSGVLDWNFLTAKPWTNLLQPSESVVLQDQAPVHLVVEVQDAGVTVETSETPVVWNPTVNLGLQQYVQEQERTVGFTEEDRTVLTTVESAVARAWQTLTGAILETPIGSILAHPDNNLLSYSPSSFTLSGRGELVTPSAAGVVGVYGIKWTVTTHPPGAGLRDGSIQRYLERVVQFVPQHRERVGQTTYEVEVFESGLADYLWQWADPFPYRVLYDVTPGFVLTCRWFGAY